MESNLNILMNNDLLYVKKKKKIFFIFASALSFYLLFPTNRKTNRNPRKTPSGSPPKISLPCCSSLQIASISNTRSLQRKPTKQQRGLIPKVLTVRLNNSNSRTNKWKRITTS